MHEWPLLIFTLLLGAAIGLTGIAALFGAFLRAGGMNDGPLAYTLRPPVIAAAVLGLVALAASFLHLGYPLNAPNALRHVDSSWLSREIVGTSIFIGFICLTAFWSIWKGTPNLFMLLVCFIMGIFDTVFMGELYRNTSVTTWMHEYTHVMFIGGVVLCGALLGLMLIGPRAARTSGVPVRWMFAWAAGLSLAAIAAELIVLPSYVSFIETAARKAVVTLPFPAVAVYQQFGDVRCLHWALSLIGGALILYAAWKAFYQEKLRFGTAAVAAFFLISGAIFGRIGFYAIHALA